MIRLGQFTYSQNQNFEEKSHILPKQPTTAIIFIDQSSFNHYSINNAKFDIP